MFTSSPVRFLFTAAAVTLVLSIGRTADAADEAAAAVATAATPTITQSCGVNAGAPIPLVGALITAHRTTTPTKPTEGLVWDARFIVDVDAAFDFRGGFIPMAVPLPTGETLQTAPHLTAVMEQGRIVGLCVDREAIHDRTISAGFLQPSSAGAGVGDWSSTITMGAPIAKGNAVHIIDGRLNGNAHTDTRVEIAAGDILERHVGYVAPRAIGHAAREEARRLTETKAEISANPVYVRGEDVRAAGGLTGRIVDGRSRAKGSGLSVGILFAGVVGALVFAARRLRQSASVERADAMLASEIDEVAASAAATASSQSKKKKEI